MNIFDLVNGGDKMGRGFSPLVVGIVVAVLLLCLGVGLYMKKKDEPKAFQNWGSRRMTSPLYR